MNVATALFTSSIGRKILMAVSGLILVGFVTGHLVGNLQIFSPPDVINGYAAFLQGLGPLLWIVRIGLLAAFALHVWAAVVLTLENRRARPREYGFKHTIQATLASRMMRWSGLVVLAFVAYHLAHFTIGVGGDFTQQATFKDHHEYVMQADYKVAGLLVVPEGAVVHDVFNMVVRGFQSPIVSGFYLLAIGLLTVHLWHGFESSFQTLGLRTNRWSGALRFLTRGFCILYLLGNLAIPGAVLLGFVEPHSGAGLASAHVHP